MSGSNPIGSAPDVQLGTPLIDTTGEITGAQPVASIPFTATAGQAIRATVDGIPSASTDFILTVKDTSGTVLTTVDTGTSPELINRTFTTAGTYTFEGSGYQADLGDVTFKVQRASAAGAPSAAAGVVPTAKEWGQTGGDEVTAEFRNPGVA